MKEFLIGLGIAVLIILVGSIKVRANPPSRKHGLWY
jgi:hypothetical protein